MKFRTAIIPPPGNPLSQREYIRWTLIIVGIGLILRVLQLDFSYSNDELSALGRTRFDSFSDLVTKGVMVDGHPGGVQAFMYFWVKLFGMSEWIVRLPFALAGAAGIWFTIRLFAFWFGRNAGLLTGAFVSFLYFPLLFSQIARPYGIGLSLSMAMIYFWTRLLNDEKPRKDIAVAYTLFTAACMYNHYFSFLLALIVGLTGLFLLKRDRLWLYLGAGLGASLLFSPHIYITLFHLGVGGVGQWLGKPGLNWPLLHIAYIFNNSYLIAGLLLLIAITQVLWFSILPGSNRFRFMAALFFMLPLLIGYTYSRMVNPVLQDSVLIFSFPFLPALIFSFSEKIPAKFMNVLLGLVMITGLADTVIVKDYYHRQHFGEFRGVAEAICEWNSDFGKENITQAIGVNNPWYIHYYLEREGDCDLTFEQYSSRGEADLDTLKTILDTCSTPYFLYAFTKPVPAEIRDMILARFPCIVKDRNFSGLTAATLFSRHDEPECLNRQTGVVFLKNDFDSIATAETSGRENPEFYPGYEGIPAGADCKPVSRLTASAIVHLSGELKGTLLVASFHDADGETVYWKASRAELFARSGEWSTIRLGIDPPSGDFLLKTLKIYIWNPGHNKLKIKELKLTCENPV